MSQTGKKHTGVKTTLDSLKSVRSGIRMGFSIHKRLREQRLGVLLTTVQSCVRKSEAIYMDNSQQRLLYS